MESATSIARELRKNQTYSEQLLWEKLRNRRFAGLKFTRQHPVFYIEEKRKKFFVADFFCNSLELVIEVDGGIHEKQKDYDQRREEVLTNKSLKIIRFTDSEIENNINRTMIKLKRYIDNNFPK